MAGHPPLTPLTGSRARRIGRRAGLITAEILLLVLLTVLAPVLVPVAGAVDAALWLHRRKPPTALRLYALAWFFAASDMCVLVAYAVMTLANGGRDTPARRRFIFATRRRWTGWMIAAARRLLGMRFEVEGADRIGPGPVVVLVRHASIVDTMLPDGLLGRRHRLDLRYVLKRELELVPGIDIYLHQIPTLFVRRGSRDTAAELAQLARLATHLRAGEGVLIWPEGTRFSPDRLDRARASLRERRPDLAPLADGLRATLPPRPAGTLALLENAPDADVVVIAHTGLEGVRGPRDLWSGTAIGRRVRVAVWREPASAVPDSAEERERWLFALWQEVDDWVSGELGSSPRRPRIHHS